MPNSPTPTPAPAPFLRSPDRARTLGVLGDVYRLLATGDDTGGRCVVIDAIIPPGGGPPPHSHTREDEHFTVLEGELTFLSDGRERTGKPGDYVFAPRSHIHTFTNKTTKPARMLMHIAPAGIERMFIEIGRELSAGAAIAPPPTPADIAKATTTAPHYGITLHP